MKKFNKILTIISTLLTILLAWLSIDLFISYFNAFDKWLLFGLILANISVGVVTMLLTIIYVIVLMKHNYDQMKSFVHMHSVLLIVNIASLVIGVVLYNV